MRYKIEVEVEVEVEVEIKKKIPSCFIRAFVTK
jgi:hypothetical protein